MPGSAHLDALADAEGTAGDLKTQNALLVQSASPIDTSGKSSGSWLTKKVVGPIPGWGVLAIGGVTFAGLAGLAVKMWRR
jgi:hypothetical protein